MKAHIGVDSKTKLIHAVVATAANVHDAAVLQDLLHGEETQVWGDQADRGKRAMIPAVETPSTRAIVAIGQTAWIAFMNWKTRTGLPS